MIIIKYITYLIIILLFITGCSNKVNINKNDVITIKYQDITINSKEYDKLIDKINSLNLSKRKVNDSFKKKLIITDEKGIYTIKISDKNNIQYTNGNKIYYSKNQKTIKSLRKEVEKIIDTYQDKSFYKFSTINNYQENDNDLIIKLDNVNQYFKLTSELPLKDLTIHRVEKKGNSYYDIDYLYNKKNINTKNIYIRMNPLKDYSSYRISFTNKYGMNVSIIPTIDNDKETGEIKYITSYNFMAK